MLRSNPEASSFAGVTHFPPASIANWKSKGVFLPGTKCIIIRFTREREQFSIFSALPYYFTAYPVFISLYLCNFISEFEGNQSY